jgi:chromosome partitioning protein
MLGFDLAVIAIVLGAGVIAVFLIRELLRTQKTDQITRTAHAGGNPLRSRSDTEDNSSSISGFPLHTRTSPPGLNADSRDRASPEYSSPPAETVVAAPSGQPQEFLTQSPVNGLRPYVRNPLRGEATTAWWADLKRARSARFVSFINFKGGVGKSTLAVEIATSLAKHYGKRVLLIDLDPQMNATFYLMDHSKWQSWQETNGSLKTLFEAYLAGQGSTFDISQVIKKDLLSQKGTSLVPNLALLPSHLALIQVDVQLAAQMNREEGTLGNLAILRRALQRVQDQYGYVFFDCPPHFSLVTQNGLFASDAYVIPAIPDYLSTLGIDLIQAEVDRFSLRIREACSRFGETFAGPELKGIIFTRVRVRSRTPLRFLDLHERRIQEVYRTNPQLVFKNFVSEAVRFAEAPERQLPVCLSLRSEDRDANSEFLRLTEEFLERIGEQEEPQSVESTETSSTEEPAQEPMLVS